MSEEARVIAGRYRLESLIGEGGMASVWRARDLTLERLVAVKLLFARDERDKQRIVQQFVREARIAASVHHRNVVHIVDFGTTPEQQPFMVMELLEGESLGQRMRREPELGLTEVVHIAALTLRGLAAVHDAGIIHRDLKPENIFLTRDRTSALFPKILDFGISRSTEPRSGRRSALTTRDGMIVGTPEYMSPEQARGVRSIDKRTDIYSMGCILYEALTGSLPFDCENVGDLIIQIVTGTAEPVHERNPAVPKELSDVVAKAMARAPEQRFQDAGEMQEALIAAARAALDGKLSVTFSDIPPVSDALLTARQSQERLRTLEFALDGDSDPEPPIGPRIGVPLAAPPPAGMPLGTSAAVLELPPSLQPARRKRAMAWSVLSLCVIGAAWLLWPSAERAPGTPPSAQQHAAAQPPPLAPRSTTITVQLRGLPQDAIVTVDGMPASGARIELPRDGQNRVIRVSAPGKSVWQAVHHASGDGSYDVFLADDPQPPQPRAEKAARRAPPKRAARPSSAAARPKAVKRPPSVLRQPDF